VRRPPEDGDGLRMMPSILDRLLSPKSSGSVLSRRFSELALWEFTPEGDDEWRLCDVEEEIEFR
jgi:hypothetical protein